MPRARFCDKTFVESVFRDKMVVIVGSGPGSLSNPPGFIDSHEVIVRVNNYKLMGNTGRRTDVFYSYFGLAVKKRISELKRDGVKLCMAKCPNAKIMKSEWHESTGQHYGVDFREIYERRKEWWFCKTYVPTMDEFMAHFHLLDGHVPTTGFSAILDVLSYNPAHVYLTGFDFFTTKIHNLNERWRSGNPDDPIGHVPDAERMWLKENIDSLPISMDARMKSLVMS
jgi:hypothetical protein